MSDVVKRLEQIIDAWCAYEAGQGVCSVAQDAVKEIKQLKAMIEPAFHLAYGSRDTLRDWADVMRTEWHKDDDTIDQIIENLDRISDLLTEDLRKGN